MLKLKKEKQRLINQARIDQLKNLDDTRFQIKNISEHDETEQKKKEVVSDTEDEGSISKKPRLIKNMDRDLIVNEQFMRNDDDDDGKSFGGSSGD